MIICPNRNIVFVHIPKCAGTSIRGQIVLCDPEHYELARVGSHPELGMLDLGHVPLDLLHKHFPDHARALRSMDAFAVVRDPVERFGSALRQVFWQYEKRPMTLIPKVELRDMTLGMLDQVAAEIDAPSHPLIFFMRQERFIFDQGKQVVRNLIPLDLVPDFISYLSARTDTPMEAGAKANQNLDLRINGPAAKLAYGINDVMRKWLPQRLHSQIKARALGLISTGRSAAESTGILDLQEVQDFVRDHYARDAEIFRVAAAGREGLRAALAAGRLPTASHEPVATSHPQS